jgi:cephalosporin-C deacetylase
MPLTDLSLAEALALRPELPEPADLDAFWARTLRETAGSPDGPSFTRTDNGLVHVTTYDVTVPGFAGQPVRGWLHLPAGAVEPLGCVVEFLGYGRGRGLPHEQLLWSTADTPISSWTPVDRAGRRPEVTHPTRARSSGPYPGSSRGASKAPRTTTTGGCSPTRCAASKPPGRTRRSIRTGSSSPGSAAVAGLVPDLAGVMPDVPFLCDFRRGARIAPSPPYTEIAEYLKLHRDRTETVFTTLSYFDAALLAKRATAPALFSIAMMDDICPPSTCFAAYHQYAGRKDVRVYEFNGHEGGGGHHERAQLAWLRELFGATPSD